MMDLFPAGTSTVACSLPFAAHESVVAVRVFEVPFEVVYDRVEVQARGPFHCWVDRSNAMAAAFAPMVRRLVTMEDLSLENQ